MNNEDLKTKGIKVGQPQDSIKTDNLDSDATACKSQGSRRKILKTAITSGAVIAGSSQVELSKWAKPIVRNVVLPAHATTSLVDDDGGDDTCNLTCVAGTEDIGFVTSSMGDIIRTIHVRDSTATVCSGLADVPVSLNVSVTELSGTVNSASAFLYAGNTMSPTNTAAGGVATFSEVDVFYNISLATGGSIRLDMEFSAEGQTETCSITFTESANPP